jgi:hypothetical protein
MACDTASRTGPETGHPPLPATVRTMPAGYVVLTESGETLDYAVEEDYETDESYNPTVLVPSLHIRSSVTEAY